MSARSLTPSRIAPATPCSMMIPYVSAGSATGAKGSRPEITTMQREAICLAKRQRHFRIIAGHLSQKKELRSVGWGENVVKAAVRTLIARVDLTRAARCAQVATLHQDYFFVGAAAICSITKACEPPRSYNFPLAATRPPANSRSRLFCPVAGVVSAMGQ